jgi:hypothetical protein
MACWSVFPNAERLRRIGHRMPSLRRETSDDNGQSFGAESNGRGTTEPAPGAPSTDGHP